MLLKILIAVVLTAALGIGLCGMAVVNTLGLSREARDLRDSIHEAMPGPWETQVELAAGAIALGVLRTGVAAFRAPEEARAALSSVRRVEVGVYRVAGGDSVDASGLLGAADHGMRQGRWHRALAVAGRGRLVAVYLLENASGRGAIEFAVVVLNDSTLVVATGRGNLDPVLALVRDHSIRTPHLRLSSLRRDLDWH